MNAFLLALSFISVAAALLLGVIAWQARAEQRRRSAARVALLASAIGATDAVTESVPISSLFDNESGAMMQGRPLIKAAVVAALGVALVVFAAVTAGRDSLERSLPASQADAGDTSAPLELMTMRHAREGSELKVTGLVRNPSSGVQMSRITAVVFAFDRDGALIASAHAPLDFTVLAPGDESPFVVTIPNASDVGRYRVSFRSEQGALRHVDRRASSQLARSEMRNP
jgi:hypothetical protein